MPESILSHISVGCSNLPRSRAFYDAALAPLGIGVLMEEGGATAYGKDFPEFWIGAAADPTGLGAQNGLHVSFLAPDRAAVDAFHAAAIANGGTCNGPPGERNYTAGYYAAFVKDPDGLRIEAMLIG